MNNEEILGKTLVLAGISLILISTLLFLVS